MSASAGIGRSRRRTKVVMPSPCCARDGTDCAPMGLAGKPAKRVAMSVPGANGESGRARPHGAGVPRGRGIERDKLCAQPIGGCRDIGLGQQQPIRQRHLAARLRVPIERRLPVLRVHHVMPAMVSWALRRHVAIGHQRLQDRRRVGEAGGSRSGTRSIADLAPLAPAPQVEQRRPRGRLRTAQHRHPVAKRERGSSLLAISSWSRPISPNSLTITAVRANRGRAACARSASSCHCPGTR